ncbi:PDGLE domain-containing protein [Pyrobaculum calidifontis]|uniref:Cobalamin biosynthesis protein n=1 Tax=Pyrobaculum calidifontis (strain DSM 21063 / JCM 11548 / VA1) TaxID=410359 RepID=A3MWG0_PYRCJ|nr:PDGLE domain-containing protein [Pyrobaculum calidifontis]ABO08977.1 cobalamin biosynthesis protein [Pyrobaculum calidifontis JCM 11548]
MIGKRYLIIITILLLISPIFGVWLSDLVGYAEPLDHVAETLQLNESEFNWTPFKDYTVPGLPDEVGYIVAGVIGFTIFLLLTYTFAHVGGRKSS